MLYPKYRSSRTSSFKEENVQTNLRPGAWPILTPGALYEQIWKRSTRRCNIPNIKALRFQRFCYFFCLLVAIARVMGRIQSLEQLLVELYPRNIPAKFHQDWPFGLGEEDV